MTSAGCGAIAVSGIENTPPIEIELPPRPRLLCCACGIASVTATSCTSPRASIRCQMLSAKAIRAPGRLLETFGGTTPH